MSESYEPDPGVTPLYPYNTVFLSQRDLGLQVPINYVTVPGVSFSAACFPRLRFEDDKSGDCLSNLLTVGFRRLEIDLYWDQGRQVWSFCPVAIPASIKSAAPAAGTQTLSFSSNNVVSLTSTAIAPTSGSSRVTARQVSSDDLSGSSLSSSQSPGSTSSPTIFSSASQTASAAASSLGQDSPPVSIIPDSNNDPLVSIGPYVCTTTINLSTFTSQLLSYIKTTQDTLQANIMYVIINIHAAASDTGPSSPAPSPTSLPQPSNLLGSLFNANFSSFIYTPTILRDDRTNLNGSWYTVPSLYRPADEYYYTNSSQYGIVSTADGWPSEYYVEFSKSMRLLLGWGSVDPQMSGYNFTGDESVIFPNGYIQDIEPNISASTTGQLTNGCFSRSGTDDLSQINSSWANEANLLGFDYPVSETSDLIPLLNLTTNTTSCGISPILNVTLLNATAHDNAVPYRNYSYATVWSWAYGEPKNFTNGDASSESLFRCATPSIDLGGRWVVSDCSQHYYAACKAPKQPYNWTITTYPISYSYASQACPDHFDFAAPRTALENSYLTQAMRDNHRDYDGHGVWVDFNSLDYQNCWVSGGPNATCPYKNDLNQEDDLKKKTVLVPSLAALIVLVITALTLFVKVAGNRKVRKRTKKRANNGFIYEGVPS